jgi:hypothetical protein
LRKGCEKVVSIDRTFPQSALYAGRVSLQGKSVRATIFHHHEGNTRQTPLQVPLYSWSRVIRPNAEGYWTVEDKERPLRHLATKGQIDTLDTLRTNSFSFQLVGMRSEDPNDTTSSARVSPYDIGCDTQYEVERRSSVSSFICILHHSRASQYGIQ